MSSQEQALEDTKDNTVCGLSILSSFFLSDSILLQISEAPAVASLDWLNPFAFQFSSQLQLANRTGVEPL